MEPACTTRMVAVAADYSATELERLLGIVSDQGINLDAYTADDTGVHLFAPDPDRLKQVIMDAGFYCQIVDVLSLEVDNRPGQVRRVLGALKEADVQVLSLFGMGISTSGRIFIRVGDVDKAVQALKESRDVRSPPLM